MPLDLMSQLAHAEQWSVTEPSQFGQA